VVGIKKKERQIEVTTQQAEKQWQYRGETVLTARAELPHTESCGAAGRRFRHYYRLFARSFFHYCQYQLLPQAIAARQQERSPNAVFLPAAATLETEITLQQGAVCSLCTRLTENSSGRRLQLCRGDSWDLRQGLPLSLEELFPSPAGLRRRLIAAILPQLQQRMKQQPSLWRQDALRRCRRFFNRENYYLSPQGIHLFYPMFALGDLGAGTPDFLLPWAEDGPRLPPELAGETKKDHPA